jgi:hypothetical protein
LGRRTDLCGTSDRVVGPTKIAEQRSHTDPEAEDAAGVVETSRAFHERTLTATFEVVFIGDMPADIWAFERLSFFERPGQPDQGTRLDRGEGTSVRAGWRDVYGRLFNGVAWRR